MHIYHSRASQRGHGIGGLFKGWLNRTIPIVKKKAIEVGKEMGVQLLDSAYNAGREALVTKINKGTDPNATYVRQIDKDSPVSVIAKEIRHPKKPIKRKTPPGKISRTRNAKRKRTNINNSGFRKITL